MNPFTAITLLLELLVQYFSIKNKMAEQDYIERVDSKINKLSEERDKLRLKKDSASHEAANKLNDDIADEKKKLTWFLDKLKVST